LALQTPKFYLAGSKRAQESGFLRSIDRKNPQFEQALMGQGIKKPEFPSLGGIPALYDIPKPLGQDTPK
jgi:hypothetical protein